MWLTLTIGNAMSVIEATKTDDLVTMDEDELRHKARAAKRTIRKCRDYYKRSQFEVECCYIQREIEVRERRRIKHSEWLTENRPYRNKVVIA